MAQDITAHRAQGQTISSSLVSVDLGLNNPDKRLPPDVGSILYVACTRVERLEYLFVSPIFPDVWKKIGQSEIDKHRRTVEDKLKTASLNFALVSGKYREMNAEMNWKLNDEPNTAE